MSSTINASTASGGGIITSADASGILQLQTAGVTALSISAAQVVSFTNPVALTSATLTSATLTSATLTSATLTSATLTSATLTSATLTTPTIDSAQVPTISGTAPLYMCRAWVNFNGTGTVAIRASGNVSSITDNGAGNYTVNFTTAMPDANYSANITAETSLAAGSFADLIGVVNGGRATGSVRITCVNSTDGVTERDVAAAMISIFR